MCAKSKLQAMFATQNQFAFCQIITLSLTGCLALWAPQAFASPVTYSASMPQAYGSATACSSPLTGTFNVTDAFSVTDLNVRFRASHPWRTDTNLSIASPLGTTVDLLTGNYGANLDNYNVTFDDAAGVVVDTGSHAVNQSATGTGVNVRSESDPLSDFNGEAALGTWTYSICDVYTPADNGNALELSLIFDVPPNLDASKTNAVYPPAQYALPGADMIYTIAVSNTGLGSVDTDTVFLVDSLPAEVTFYNGDMDDGGGLTTDPVAFAQTGSGLTLTYASDVAYSNAVAKPASFAACTYTPAAGYDANVRHICFNPKGEFLAGSPDPEFTLSFRVRIN